MAALLFENARVLDADAGALRDGCSVRVEGDTFVYVQRVHTVAADAPDAAEIGAALGPHSRDVVCAPTMLREVVTAGGTVRVEWLHAGGEPFVAYSVGPTDCP